MRHLLGVADKNQSELPDPEERTKDEMWCNKRYEKENDTKWKKSAGCMFAMHDCGFLFPPEEMVGAESLMQVHLVICSTPK